MVSILQLEGSISANSDFYQILEWKSCLGVLSFPSLPCHPQVPLDRAGRADQPRPAVLRACTPVNTLYILQGMTASNPNGEAEVHQKMDHSGHRDGSTQNISYMLNDYWINCDLNIAKNTVYFNLPKINDYSIFFQYVDIEQERKTAGEI